jgi:hypothetical protein
MHPFSSKPLKEFQCSFILLRSLFGFVFQLKVQLKLWSCGWSNLRRLWRGIWKKILNKFIVLCNITSCHLSEICKRSKFSRGFLVSIKQSITRNYFFLTTCCLTLKLEALQVLKMLVFTCRKRLTSQKTCLQHHRSENLKTHKNTENEIEGTKKSHTTSVRRNEQGPVKYTQSRMFVCTVGTSRQSSL